MAQLGCINLHADFRAGPRDAIGTNIRNGLSVELLGLHRQQSVLSGTLSGGSERSSQVAAILLHDASLDAHARSTLQQACRDSEYMAESSDGSMFAPSSCSDSDSDSSPASPASSATPSQEEEHPYATSFATAAAANGHSQYHIEHPSQPHRTSTLPIYSRPALDLTSGAFGLQLPVPQPPASLQCSNHALLRIRAARQRSDEPSLHNTSNTSATGDNSDSMETRSEVDVHLAAAPQNLADVWGTCDKRLQLLATVAQMQGEAHAAAQALRNAQQARDASAAEAVDLRERLLCAEVAAVVATDAATQAGAAASASAATLADAREATLQAQVQAALDARGAAAVAQKLEKELRASQAARAALSTRCDAALRRCEAVQGSADGAAADNATLVAEVKRLKVRNAKLAAASAAFTTHTNTFFSEKVAQSHGTATTPPASAPASPLRSYPLPTQPLSASSLLQAQPATLLRTAPSTAPSTAPAKRTSIDASAGLPASTAPAKRVSIDSSAALSVNTAPAKRTPVDASAALPAGTASAKRASIDTSTSLPAGSKVVPTGVKDMPTGVKGMPTGVATGVAAGARSTVPAAARGKGSTAEAEGCANKARESDRPALQSLDNSNPVRSSQYPGYTPSLLPTTPRPDSNGSPTRTARTPAPPAPGLLPKTQTDETGVERSAPVSDSVNTAIEGSASVAGMGFTERLFEGATRRADSAGDAAGDAALYMQPASELALLTPMPAALLTPMPAAAAAAFACKGACNNGASPPASAVSATSAAASVYFSPHYSPRAGNVVHTPGSAQNAESAPGGTCATASGDLDPPPVVTPVRTADTLPESDLAECDHAKSDHAESHRHSTLSIPPLSALSPIAQLPASPASVTASTPVATATARAPLGVVHLPVDVRPQGVQVPVLSRLAPAAAPSRLPTSRTAGTAAACTAAACTAAAAGTEGRVKPSVITSGCGARAVGAGGAQGGEGQVRAAGAHVRAGGSTLSVRASQLQDARTAIPRHAAWPAKLQRGALRAVGARSASMDPSRVPLRSAAAGAGLVKAPVTAPMAKKASRASVGSEPVGCVAAWRYSTQAVDLTSVGATRTGACVRHSTASARPRVLGGSVGSGGSGTLHTSPGGRASGAAPGAKGSAGKPCGALGRAKWV